MKHIDAAVLQNLGSGTPSGVVLTGCVTAVELAKARKEMSKAIYLCDPKAQTLGDTERGRLLEVERRLGALLECLKASRAPPLASAPALKATGEHVSYVVQKSEEEREFSMNQWTSDDVSDQLEAILRMYGLNLRPHERPSLSQQKKICYWAIKEGVFADANRVPLSGLKFDKFDDSLLCFRRLCMGHLVAGAGAVIQAGLRDDGAGNVPGFAPQWISGLVVIDLLKDLEEVRDRTAPGDRERVMARVTQVMYDSLHRASQRGKQSISLALSHQISKVSEHVDRTHKPDKLDLEDERLPRKTRDGPRKRAPKRERGGDRSRRDETAESGRKYPDEVGAEGPNGLARKKGGNPSGEVCKHFNSKAGCTFKTCSYEHKKSN